MLRVYDHKLDSKKKKASGVKKKNKNNLLHVRIDTQRPS